MGGDRYQENRNRVRPQRDTDHGHAQAIEKSDVSLCEIFKTYKQEGGQLNNKVFLHETLLACAHDLGYTAVITELCEKSHESNIQSSNESGSSSLTSGKESVPIHM